MDLNRAGELNLARALRTQYPGRNLPQGSLRVAFTGAGGKTTALFQLARQLSSPVLISASTHLSTSQLTLADYHFSIQSEADLAVLKDQLFEGVVLLTGPAGNDERTSGLADPVLKRVHLLAQEAGLPLLVEADGSRRLPLKAPAEHEPAIPPFTNLVVVVAGLSGVGRRLEIGSVHRPERFAALSGLGVGEPVDEHALVRVLLHPQGGLKGIPNGARKSVLLNQADDPEQVERADRMARKLLEGYESVLAASLGGSVPKVYFVHEKVAGVILAAGGSSRLGAPKQLLRWHGIPFVRHVAQTALEAGLTPVVVVTGAVAPEVEAALQGLDVVIAHNPDWEQGQSSSVRVGVKAVPSGNGAAVFLLSDQPQVSKKLLQELAQAHSRSLPPIVAPRVQGLRANPVLFDASLFPELLQLEGDTGGRKLFAQGERYPITWIDWDDARLLLDVDTPQDYQRLINWSLNHERPR